MTVEYIEGTIASLAFGGEGVLRHQGKVVFVPFAAPHETVLTKVVEQKKSFARAEIEKVISPSPYRITPSCSYFGKCGGCQLQHIAYEQHVAIKRSFVEDALHRIANISLPVNDIEPNQKPWHYRRHIRLHIKNGRLGYISHDQKTLLPIKSCPIFVDNEYIFSLARTILTKLGFIKEGELTIFTTPDERYVLSFSLSKVPEQGQAVFQEIFSEEPRLIGIVWRSKKQLFRVGSDAIDFSLDGLTLTFNSQVFVQAHPEESKKLYLKLIEIIKTTDAKKVLDLYCGFGATSLLLRREKYDVYAIEMNPESIRVAKLNEKNNQMQGISWQVGDVESHLEKARAYKPDVVLVNPPRVGLSDVVRNKLLEILPKHLFYVSCMPATLARDLKHFLPHYKVCFVQPYDMFPETTHIETLVYLTRNA